MVLAVIHYDTLHGIKQLVVMDIIEVMLILRSLNLTRKYLGYLGKFNSPMPLFSQTQSVMLSLCTYIPLLHLGTQ